MPGYIGRADLNPKEAGTVNFTTHSLFKNTSGECIQGEMKLGQKVAQTENAIWQNHDEEWMNIHLSNRNGHI